MQLNIDGEAIFQQKYRGKQTWRILLTLPRFEPEGLGISLQSIFEWGAIHRALFIAVYVQGLVLLKVKHQDPIKTIMNFIKKHLTLR